jgi:hypothetical protein
VDRCGPGLVYGTLLAFTCRDRKITIKLNTVGVPTEIRSRQLRNTGQKLYNLSQRARSDCFVPRLGSSLFTVIRRPTLYEWHSAMIDK